MKKRLLMLLGSAAVVAAAVGYFVWAKAQLGPTGQTMARGPNQIAFVAADRIWGDDFNVYVLDADTEQVVQLTRNYHVTHITWSPDGAVLYISTNKEHRGDLTHQIDPATGVITPLDPSLHASDLVTLTDLSPDGERMVVGTKLEGDTDFDIYSFRPDHSDIRKVLDHEGDDTWPSWSPDGKRIVFFTYIYDSTGSPAGGKAYIVDANGQRLKPLNNDQGAYINVPKFTADGKAIFQPGLGFACLVMVDSPGTDCEDIYFGSLSPDGTQAFGVVSAGPSGSVIPSGQESLLPPGSKVCIYRIEGAKFGTRRCIFSSDHMLGGPLWRP